MRYIGNIHWSLLPCIFLAILFNGTYSNVCQEQATLEYRIELTYLLQQENQTGVSWTRPIDHQFVVTCNPLSSCNPTDGYAATVDMAEEHSNLTILSVQLRDVGKWTMTDAVDQNNVVPVCELRAASIPTCNIHAEQDTEALDIGTNLSLTINITGYYCTKNLVINITTGTITKEILTKDAMSGLMNEILPESVNVTSNHLGDVTLSFTCDDVPKHLTCQGVTRLLQRTTTVETTTAGITTVVATTNELSTHPETFTTSDSTTTDGEVIDETGNDDTVDVVLIAGIAAAGFLVLLIAILMIVFRDKMKKTYKYIVYKKKGNREQIGKDNDVFPLDED